MVSRMVKDINFKHSEHARILVRRDPGIYIIEIYVGALKHRLFRVKFYYGNHIQLLDVRNASFKRFT